MRTLPPAVAAELAGPATRLAHAFVVRRADGAVFGFTDHDRSLTVDGVPCEPASGFDRSVASAHAGFAVGEEEIAGALTSSAITEADLAAGLWDGASVAVWLVPWATPSAAMLLRSAALGEVTRADGAFRAELRGPARVLDRVAGRRFDPACDATFGDARCGKSEAAYTVAATVAAGATARRVPLAGLTQPSGWFSRGVLQWGTIRAEIEDHLADAGGTRLLLRRPLAEPPPAGTAVSLVAGCDKSLATCRGTFANALNFRGFPHMPGRDVVFSVARADGSDDGGVVVP